MKTYGVPLTEAPVPRTRMTGVSDNENVLCNTHKMAQLQKYRPVAGQPSERLDVPEAHSPNPEDGATAVDILSVLSWTTGCDAASHNVYVGTDSSLEFQGNQTNTFFDPGTLSYSTTYFWRVDEVENGGPKQGNTWNFTTEAAPPVTPDEAFGWRLLIPPYIWVVFVFWVGFMWMNPIYSTLYTIFTIGFPWLIAKLVQHLVSQKNVFKPVCIIGTWILAILYVFGVDLLIGAAQSPY